MTDFGILTSDRLPIYKLYYGGAITPYSQVQFDIGPFICSGKRGLFPSEVKDFKSKMMMSNLENIRNELDVTKNDLSKVATQLESHLRKTTTITENVTTKATTTITTTESTVSAVQFEKSGPFSSSLNNKIGEIQFYHKNFEFTMEVKYNSHSMSTQLLLVSQDPSYSIGSSMIILRQLFA